MRLKVEVMDKTRTLESILMFQVDGASMYWRRPLFRMYHFLDENKGLNVEWQERKRYISDEMSNHYDQVKDELRHKVESYQSCWDEKQADIVAAFTKVFGVSCDELFNDMIADVSLNPICPRDINNHIFSVFYQGDEQKFLETSLHEIIHFVWFFVWQKHFRDDNKEYEGPHLKWVLSEMVVDTLVCCTDIGKFFADSSIGNVAYKYFYSMMINGKPVLEELSQMYQKAENIKQFMEQAYEYCQENEEKIRRQML